MEKPSKQTIKRNCPVNMKAKNDTDFSTKIHNYLTVISHEPFSTNARQSWANYSHFIWEIELIEAVP